MKKKTLKKFYVRKYNKKKIIKRKIIKKKIIPIVKRKYTKKNKIIPSVVIEVKPPKKISSDKMYFTQDTENAIIQYNSEIDDKIRNDIYNTKIKYPFEKLVENIFNTFKFSYFEVGPLEIQKETITHLVANIHKFEAGKGKAFSYFSIIAKHYLIALNNSTWKRRNQHSEISEENEENTIQLQSEDKHYKEMEMVEFIKKMISFWEKNIGKIFTKTRDLDIANAVIELFRQSDVIEAFNKKALYLYIREISDCKTQQITKVINKMKSYQNNITKSYRDDGDIFTNSYNKV